MVPLLPKLRGHFAEFLNEGYPDRLGMLYLSTSVGLRYGHLTISLEAFLGGLGSVDLPLAYRRLTITPQAREADLPTSVIALQAWTSPKRRSTYLSASPHCVLIDRRWYGNINPLSIAYASRPRLRPD